MVVLYDFLPSPGCRTVKMTAKLIGVELSCIPVDYMQKEHLSESYRKMNPFHTLPLIVDDGLTIFESRAITVYLINKYKPESPLYPKDPAERAIVDQMLHLDNGTIFPTGDLILLPKIMEGKEPSPEAYAKAKDVLGNLDFILSTRSYAAGNELSLADLSITTSLSLFEMGLYDMTSFPNVTSYMARIRSELSPMFQEINDGPVDDIKNKVAVIMKQEIK